MSTLGPILSLAELDVCDPSPIIRGDERRYLCPLCGDDKPRDNAHRCLAANIQSGAWKCYRCSTSGKLRESWSEQTREMRSERSGAALRRAFSVQTIKTPSASLASQQKAIEREKPVSKFDWHTAWQSGAPISTTEAKIGDEYLQQRGITSEIASLAGVRFCRRWNGGASVVFPIHNQSGELVAAQGRHIVGNGKRTSGVLRRGVFLAPSQINERIFAPFDEAAPAIIICEAPIDALSIACAGFPALALCGVARPDWLHRACAFRAVFVAFDADNAGDQAAHKLVNELASYGAQCQRLRPEGGKDWNESLCAGGVETLAQELTKRILI